MSPLQPLWAIALCLLLAVPVWAQQSREKKDNVKEFDNDTTHGGGASHALGFRAGLGFSRMESEFNSYFGDYSYMRDNPAASGAIVYQLSLTKRRRLLLQPELAFEMKGVADKPNLYYISIPILLKARAIDKRVKVDVNVGFFQAVLLGEGFAIIGDNYRINQRYDIGISVGSDFQYEVSRAWILFLDFRYNHSFSYVYSSYSRLGQGPNSSYLGWRHRQITLCFGFLYQFPGQQ